MTSREKTLIGTLSLFAGLSNACGAADGASHHEQGARDQPTEEVGHHVLALAGFAGI